MTKDTEVRDVKVLPLSNYFKIFKDGKHAYDFFMKLSPLMNMDECAEFYEKSKKEGNPLPANSIQVFGIMEDAVKSGNPDLMDFLFKRFRYYCIGTSTKAVYSPLDLRKNNENGAIHNYGTSDAYFLQGNLIGGRSGLEDIKNLVNPSPLELFLKTKDIRKINKISNAINKTNTYLQRYTYELSEKTECVVRFGADDGGFGIYAYRYQSVGIPSFLILQVK